MTTSTHLCTQDLVTNGAQVSICNKYGETPLDKAKPHLRELLKGILTPRHHAPHSNIFKCIVGGFCCPISHCELIPPPHRTS